MIQQCLFNVAKQRSQWWDRIIPLLCNQSLPQNLTSSQQISLRFSQRSILLYLLKMPAMKQFRNNIVATLKKLETKSDAIDSAIRYADVSHHHYQFVNSFLNKTHIDLTLIISTIIESNFCTKW